MPRRNVCHTIESSAIYSSPKRSAGERFHQISENIVGVRKLDAERAKRIVKQFQEFAETEAWGYLVEELDKATMIYASRMGEAATSNEIIRFLSGAISANTKFKSLPMTVAQTLLPLAEIEERSHGHKTER